MPVVGIGASAGGLEALELFLANTPADGGLAYVIIQHMDPTHSGAMVQLLQRVARMPVCEATEGLAVLPDRVYVIPPNTEMSLVSGALHLVAPTDPRGARRPIDAFFASLACELGPSGVGVVLSGMGTDGTAGMRALRERGGATLAQECASARFPGMPGSAIAAGVVGIAAPVEDLPRLILERVRRGPAAAAAAAPEDEGQSGLQRIVTVLRDRTGHDFSQYKKSTLYRRVERRMAAHQIERIATYARLLRESPQEGDLLFRELLIGVTRFFRDPDAWRQLGDEVLPSLIAAAPAHGVLRAWVPGCASGEEAFSTAMSFLDAVERCVPRQPCSLQIFATDLDADAIARARAGVYPLAIAADVGPERLERYFERGESVFRVTKQVRDMVVFAPHNVLMDPPFTKLELLACRNLLIYLEPEAQRRLFALFHYSLRPGGVLFLGAAETATDRTLFVPLERENRLYRRADGQPAPGDLLFPRTGRPGAADAPPGDWPRAPREVPSVEAAVEQALLHRFCPAAVLTSDQGDILYVSGRTGGYLEPPAGRTNWNVFAMAREGLRYPLAAAFQEAVREWREVRLASVRIASEGGARIGAVTVHPLDGVSGLARPVLIVFEGLARPPSRREREESADARQFASLREELQQARDAEGAAQEELRSVQEELTSSNEELQSTNEELQSTNEELTTSYEEMQSLNEELQTVNHELQSRVTDLSRVNDDMANLLNSTDIATLFLDSVLRIRRFTPATTSIMKLIDGDVGRPVTDLVTELDYPTFADDAREVLRTLAHSQQQVRARDGRWFQVRIMPYRTLIDQIDGAVITFTDVSAAKALEQVLGEVGASPGVAPVGWRKGVTA